MSESQNARARTSWAQTFGFVAAGGLALVALGIGAVAGRFTAPSPPPAPSAITVVRPTPDVVVAIRDLAELTSAEYHVERVIDLTEKQRTVFGLVEAEDAILLIAAGSVTAGVDLAELKDEHVQVAPEAKRARIRLPPPKILRSRIDNERTYVHRRDTDLLARRQEHLETRARREAERTITKAAEQAEILDRARRNARRSVEALVRSLGYTDVKVTYQDEAP
jgi:hypothetical protein